MPFHYDLLERRPGQKCDHTGKIQKYMMCRRSIALHIPAGVEKVNEGGQRHVPIALYYAQSSEMQNADLSSLTSFAYLSSAGATNNAGK